ncbi:MAG: NusA-like transcription termination signal-binding factor [Nitrososphaeria archaeon]|nr:NusA-like transcription termination signal-binding factor [Conexivisphaerales archaeon]
MKYTNDDINFMKLFSSVSGVFPMDVIKDDRFNRIIVVVKKDDIAKAIGKEGSNVTYIKKTMKKDVVIVGYTEDLTEFVKGLVGENVNLSVKESTSPNGGKTVILQVPQEQKGLVFGAKGQNIEKIKLLLKRYFDVSYVKVV